MRKTTLVFGKRFGLWLALAAATTSLALRAGTFGSVIQLSGHISEIALDEPRSALYAANFTAGQVDVISTTSNRLVSSLVVGGYPSGLCLSPDGSRLLVTNYNNFGATLGSVILINLNDLTRQNYAMTNHPLGCAFGADGAALIVTAGGITRFRPNGGTFENVAQLPDLASACSGGTPEPLPVPEPTFPREITKASMTASGDGNWIFGLTDAFVFVYQIPQPSAIMSCRATTTFVQTMSLPLASASFDGSYYMAGQYVLDRRLRVIAMHPDSDVSQVNIGGHAIDFGAQRIYAMFSFTAAAPSSGTGTSSGSGSTSGGSSGGTSGGTTSGGGTTTPGGGTTTTSPPMPSAPPTLYLMDADNLTIRDQIRLPERLVGRMVLGGGGRQAWAVTDSGVTYLPLGDLGTVPQVRPSVEQVYFQFDYCQRQALTQQLRLEGSPGTDFQLTTLLRGVTFSPSRGTTPATVTVSVDFQEYSRVQGTTFGQIVVTSQDAVNVLDPIQLAINVKDADQRGRVVTLPGRLVDILADPGREQFYVLEQKKNELHVFQNSDLRLLGSYRTGNRPTWMTLSADRRLLVIANSAGENFTLINLDTRRNQGLLFTPWGHQPVSVAADNLNALAAVRVACCSPTLEAAPTVIDWVDLSGRIVYKLDRLGAYINEVHNNTAMVPLANMTGIFIAEADGRVKLWNSSGSVEPRAVIVRKDFAGLQGAIAAGPTSVVVQNHILNLSLVPQADFSDPPAFPAGFIFTGDNSVRTLAPGGAVVDTGAVMRYDTRTPAVRRTPVRMVEQPLTPINFAFLRSLAQLRNGTIVSTSSSGLVELPGNFDAGISIPRVTAITSAADFSDSLAAGSLVSIFGTNLAPATAAAGSTPLPTQLANVCVTVNGFRMPLLYASPGQINGQLPFELNGQVQTVLHTPGGLSDIYYADVEAAAPSVFQLSVSGQPGRHPAIIRNKNNQLATLSNPLRPNESFTVFLTGLGEVGPPIQSGTAAPSSPLSVARFEPLLLAGDTPLDVLFAGLAPGFVGVYQINGFLPGYVPRGTQIPLTIAVGGNATTINVRIVE
jgi:uncharacterized protein (TIGR03437 family)